MNAQINLIQLLKTNPKIDLMELLKTNEQSDLIVQIMVKTIVIARSRNNGATTGLHHPLANIIWDAFHWTCKPCAERFDYTLDFNKLSKAPARKL